MGLLILFVGSTANVIGTVPYLLGTLRGTTKPNRVSWFFWTLTPGMAALIAFSAGAGLASVPVFCSALLCLGIFSGSFFNPKAYWKLTDLDYLCGILALLALALWLLTNNPSLAIVFTIAGDFFATIPTFRKAWTHPETESPWTYVGGLLNGLSAFFVLSAWNVPSVGFPTEIVFIEITILFALYHKKLLK